MREEALFTLANREPSSTAAGVEGDGGSTSQGVPTPGLLDLDAAWPCSRGIREEIDVVDGHGGHHSSPEPKKTHTPKP